jgi:opacity protein-like surface antigen
MKKMMIAAGVGALALCSMASADALLLYQDSDDNTPPPPDAAEAASPWYLTADVGVNFAMEAEFKDGGNAGSKFKFKPGLGMNIGVGYNFTKMFGLEISSGLQWNKVKELDVSNPLPGLTVSQDSGDLYQIPLMANFVVNFNVTDKFDIGLVAGVGMQWTKFKSTNTLTTGGGGIVLTDQIAFDHNSVAFRYNFGLRMNYAITHNVRLGANFLFTGSTSVDIGSPTDAAGVAFQDETLKDLLNFGIGFGVEWSF